MNLAFGADNPPSGPLEQSARIVFHTDHLQLKWSHCSASADFLSQFYAGVLASDRSAAQINDLSHSIAYLANELIENAVKFRAPGDVQVEAGLEAGKFILRITNWIAGEISTRFQCLLREITSGDPGELLIQRIEANAADGGSSASGLGLLTLMNDYGVRLSWNFRPTEDSDGRVFLETIACLPLPDHQSPSPAKRHHGN